MKIHNSIAFVTGANGGIGSALVAELIERGASKVYAGARNINKLKNLIDKYGDSIIPVEIDITSDEQVMAAASYDSPNISS